jgi:Mg2+-importing ATPase
MTDDDASPGPGREFWARSAAEVLAALASRPSGLSPAEVATARARHGANRLPESRRGPWRLLLRQFGSPMVLLLVAAAGVSWAVGERPDAGIIVAIVIASGLVGFWQEHSADLAVGELLRRVAVRATVRRDGALRQIPVEELVPGDVVRLAAGSIVPADLRLLSADDLAVDQAALTGETFPSEKSVAPAAADAPLADRTSALYCGTHVASGAAEAVVVAIGGETEMGRLAEHLEREPPPPEFERGVQRFGVMLMRVTAVLLVLIFAATALLHHPFLEALLFSLALAVGMTPELLPAIVAINLARGAKQMAAQRVIVKRLSSIEDFGSMDVLCADKTGTLTEGTIRLDSCRSPDGEESPATRDRVAVNALLQESLPSPIDDAVRAAPGVSAAGFRKLDEVPYDFARKRLSVLVEDERGRRALVTKGALEPLLAVCSRVRHADGRTAPLAEARPRIDALFADWSQEGLRVLGVAERELPGAGRATAADEVDLTFVGFALFADVLKADAGRAVAELARLGIAFKIITGDNRRVAATIAKRVGIPAPRLLTGAELRATPPDELAARASATDLFAEIEPNQKEQIIAALQRAGHVVGFLGDGINDAPALHASDVGISVEGAVDVAKEAAEIVLLEKDLGVLGEGVRQGRRTFVNTLKYIYITMSANFGNMLSMAAAVLFLPFLPLLPKQILLNNFLSDFPAMTIGGDRVDPEAAVRPRRWDVRFIRDFMFLFGAISSLFDLLTFALLILVFHSPAEQFRSAWFVVSLVTEVAILLVMRTRRSLFASRPSRALAIASLATVLASVALPYVPLTARWFGFTPMPAPLLAATLGISAGYVAVSELAKRWFFARTALAHGADGG